MKIFLSFLQSGREHNIPAYSFWGYYLKNGIAEGGHEWAEAPGVDWAAGLVPKSCEKQDRWKQEAWGKTVAWLKNNPADLFLAYLFPQQVDKTAIKQIQNLGIPCVNFFCDNVREFQKIPDAFSAFDLNWVPEFKATSLYQNAGYPYINLPMPIWVSPKLRVPQKESKIQITFIGSKDIQRQCFFEELILKMPEFPLNIYGRGWAENEPADMIPLAPYTVAEKFAFQYNFINKNGIIPFLRKLKQRGQSTELSSGLRAKIKSFISFPDYNKLTAESMITLGVNRYPSFRFPFGQPDTYSRLRDIEAPMLGACYLTEYTDGIENMYDTGKEIEVYKDAGDLIEKAGELMANPDKRRTLRLNGQQRALNDHTVVSSINKILNKLNS